MAYWMDKWELGSTNEIEIKYAGDYGAKGEKRKKKKKVTPEQIVIQNRLNKAKKIRRLIKANFEINDYWITLTYEKGKRKAFEEVKQDVKKFLSKLRNAYKKEEDVLKFIYLIEIGKEGGIHIHIILNRLKSGHTDILLNKYWKHGHINIELMYEKGGFKQLASYLAKVPDEEQRKKGKTSSRESIEETFSTSRNLIRPEPTRKVYSKWTVRKILENGPKPQDGYYIEKESLKIGFNQYTGYSYIQYTEVKLE